MKHLLVVISIKKIVIVLGVQKIISFDLIENALELPEFSGTPYYPSPEKRKSGDQAFQLHVFHTVYGVRYTGCPQISTQKMAPNSKRKKKENFYRRN
jgi:hypothetical protein